MTTFEESWRAYLAGQFDALTDAYEALTVSEWAETRRYLPKSVTPIPGFYSYDVAPYLREIADCFSSGSPIREVDLMKGAQVGATVGVIENFIGYAIDHIKSAPVMLLTADAELAKLRVDSYITPMIQHSGLADLIRSADEGNTRKTGKTDKKIEWVGGGFLVPFGAQNADKLRSISIQLLLEDECDAFPGTVGDDGDPQKLAEARTKAYHESRKIARISTPLIKGRSRIEAGFKRGDQRYYHVPCKRCGQKQVLRFQDTNRETGEVSGLVWTLDEFGNLDPESVRYLCKFCGHAHTNDDKINMLPAGEWVPSAKPISPDRRSYHISGLYSPVSMYPWSAVVSDWLQAWDVEKARPKDMGLLQEFYNNVLGEPFELVGQKLKFAAISAHRRRDYNSGEVPNAFAVMHTGAPVQIVTCAVDVQNDYLSVGVFGWGKWSTAFVIQYFDIPGDTADLESDNSPWHKLAPVLDEREYIADDGKIYPISMTLVDSSWRTDTVYKFCSQYETGVFPIKGREMPRKGAAFKEFSSMTTTLGTQGFMITVDLYKDRWQTVLNRHWIESQPMPRGHFNAPMDITDKQLKELTVETKRERIDSSTNKVVGYEWHRPSGSRNELWDVLVYNNAALEIVAWDICRNQFELQTVNWASFWDYVEANAAFYKTS